MPDPATKRCSRCGEIKSLAEFRPERRAADGLNWWCQPCVREAGRRSYAANREVRCERKRLYREANHEAMLERERKSKAASIERVLSHYGTTCACCGAVENLTIDHVNGDGAQHRQELYGDPQQGSNRFYVWLIRQGFPAGYQTLCRRCNSSKRSGERCRLDHGLETA